MSTVLSPLTFLLSVLAGWVNNRQFRVLEFLQEENRLLRRQLGKRRLRVTDNDRRRLAAKGVQLGRKLLADIASIVTPDTILRWHRELIAKKWTHKWIAAGPSPVRKAIEDLSVGMARERKHEGLEIGLIDAELAASPPSARVIRRARLGGLLKFCFWQEE